MEKLSFTLYEIFGYLLPGGVVFLSMVVIYWAVFVPAVPLGIATFQVGVVTWGALVVTTYILGHATQGVANRCFRGVEKSVLASQPLWMRDRASQVASEILKVSTNQLEPRWIVVALDEYTVQAGKVGDREVFVYREGFYRATTLSLFFLSGAIVVRMFVPGASIMFTKGLFLISRPELVTTAAVVGVTGYLFFGRYRRFAEQRVVRAIVAALILQSTTTTEPKVKPPAEVD
jgi:hypothetical protein